VLTQRVGCDLKIGSTQHVDECGVCGGNGSSCARPMYKWQDSESSACSTTCGGGWFPIYTYICEVCQHTYLYLAHTHTCLYICFDNSLSTLRVLRFAGFRMTRPVCVNRVNKAEEDEAFCNPGQKPPATKVPCNTRRCPPGNEN
jgi:ADAMTS-like protein 1/3